MNYIRAIGQGLEWLATRLLEPMPRVRGRF